MKRHEQIKGLFLDKYQAENILRKHGHDLSEFRNEFLKEVKPNSCGMYSASKVLEWLGY